MSNVRTILSLEQAELFMDFIFDVEEYTQTKKRARMKRINLLPIFKILFALRKESMCYSKLFLESNIRMKKQYHVYLNFLTRVRFITKLPSEYGARMVYNITDRGLEFWRLFYE